MEQETDKQIEVVHSPAMSELSVATIVNRMEKIRALEKEEMVPGLDYGVIPGTNAKPTLLKPGAEKLCVMFQLGSRPPVLEKIWDGNHLTVFASVTLFHIPSGREIGTGTAVCSSKEKKYASRNAERECPKCHKNAIIKGKPEFGGGWICWKGKEGCGAKFAETDKAILDQALGKVPNEDLPDTWNTVIKMAVKRAKIDATLSATGASAIFTQDIGDDEAPEEDLEIRATEKPSDRNTPVSTLPLSSPEQRTEIRKLVESQKLDTPAVIAFVHKHYGKNKNSSADLNVMEADDFIERLKAGELKNTS